MRKSHYAMWFVIWESMTIPLLILHKTFILFQYVKMMALFFFPRVIVCNFPVIFININNINNSYQEMRIFWCLWVWSLQNRPILLIKQNSWQYMIHQSVDTANFLACIVWVFNIKFIYYKQVWDTNHQVCFLFKIYLCISLLHFSQGLPTVSK